MTVSKDAFCRRLLELARENKRRKEDNELLEEIRRKKLQEIEYMEYRMSKKRRRR